MRGPVSEESSLAECRCDQAELENKIFSPGELGLFSVKESFNCGIFSSYEFDKTASEV